MRKIALGLLCFVFFLMASAIIIPYFFKDKIIAKAKEEISNQVNAKVDFKDIDLSILKNIQNFPNIALGIDNLTIIGIPPFAGDTLLTIGKTNASLDLMSVINDEQYKIEAITLKNATINALVNKEGIANWNILKPSEEKKESKPFALALNKLKLEDININYDDLKGGTVLKIVNFNHEGKGDFAAEILDYESSTAIEKVSLAQGIVPYLKSVAINLDSKVNIDQKQNKYSFQQSKLTLNRLALLLNGFVQIPDSTKTILDISFNAEKTDFKSLLSLIPAIYSKDFTDIVSSGILKLDGFAKGTLEGNIYPAFALNLKVDNGKFRYPKLPTDVTDVFIDAHVKNSGGSLDNTVVDVPDFRLKLANEPIVAKLKVSTPISDPNIDLEAKGKVNLGDVQKYYPIKDVQKLSGIANVDLALKARQSDIINKRYQNINAAGNISANAIEYASKDVPKPISVKQLVLNFSPQYVDIAQCNAVIGNSDFDIKGKMENVIAYVMSKDAVITGSANIISNKLDANEFLPDSTTAKKSNAQKAKEVVRLPKNIDFTGTASIGELLYDQLSIKNLLGNIHLQDEQLNLNNLQGNLLGGSIIASGFYNTKTDIPTANLSYNIKDFDIQEVYKFVSSAKQAAPIMKFVTGAFLSNMNMKMSLNPDLSPDLITLDGIAGFKMPLANVKGVPALQQIVAQTKLKQLENLRIENLDVKATIANGRVLVAPFETKVNNMKMTIGGSQGLDQTMDYAVAIDVPWKDLGQATSFAEGLLAKNPIKQLNGMVPEIVRINLKVGGTFSKPIISVGKPDGTNGVGSMKDVVKEQVQQQAQQLKEEVKTQAIQTLDTIKTQVKEEAKNKLQEILSGQKNPNDTTPKKSLQDNVKDQLKEKFKWPR
ncbi:MAG TPA: AsmA-like C-terminal region-containing protein [Chitinophagales bacterium]|nr:AsmA-like C-terminal region-containing protein [Chitinophagales bacterium]HMW13090.1 AsmA-like C-terminal region-containing protein [Chitinophagales bacterium]HMX60237.1 AsmA-like C-terminal region-containing protein [Chitinophagales bacterium]HMY22514.1 AsmA-like C-terminal region-containing protein [Chitinophagales bacterium]HMZ34771.1 AsmA-like C-terminal region-containing protein [Chitinophagales bacterium]